MAAIDAGVRAAVQNDIVNRGRKSAAINRPALYGTGNDGLAAISCCHGVCACSSWLDHGQGILVCDA